MSSNWVTAAGGWRRRTLQETLWQTGLLPQRTGRTWNSRFCRPTGRPSRRFRKRLRLGEEERFPSCEAMSNLPALSFGSSGQLVLHPKVPPTRESQIQPLVAWRQTLCSPNVPHIFAGRLLHTRVLSNGVAPRGRQPNTLQQSGRVV